MKVLKRILYSLPVLLIFTLVGFGIQEYYLKDSFQVEDLAINPQSPSLSQPAEITAQIKNNSLKSKIYAIELFINDELAEVQNISFRARETKAVSFDFLENQAFGTYKFRVVDTEITAVIAAGARPFLAEGDEWNYTLTRGGLTHSVRETVVKESIIDEKNCWLRLTTFSPALDLRFDTKEECISKQNFFPIRSELNGTVSNQLNDYSYDISPNFNIFPIDVGQTITSRRTLESHTQFFDTGLDTQETIKSDVTIFVAAMEQIAVPAGTFDAFRLEYKNSDNQLILEEWRAPQIKLNIVKSVNPITGESMKLESYEIR